MFKVSLFLLTALLCMACGGRQQGKTAVGKPAVFWLPLCSADSIDHYRQQARTGRGDACLKLACCYHDGRGVRRDFLTMVTLVGHATKSTGITMKEFTAKLPENDDYRLIYTGIEAARANDDETAFLCLTALESMEYPEAEVIRWFRADTTADCRFALRDFYKSASKEDCLLKQYFACMGAMQAGDYDYAARNLPRLAESSPALWNMLGHLHTQRGAVSNDSLAARYYAKANEYALLNQKENEENVWP